MSAPLRLVISRVSKTYANGVRALDDVSLTTPAGMYGLLGPNGAGKSTLMLTIATLQQADSGSITFGDLDVLRQKNEVRKTLGYLPQEFGVYKNVCAEKLLDHFAGLKGITARVLAETLAHYGALMVMEKTHGRPATDSLPRHTAAQIPRRAAESQND